MGTRSYIVKGRGSAASYHLCSHGAGRRYSRTKAKQQFTVEIPSAYEDIDRVMADQTDLVDILHTLTQVLNYKGT